jgi:shikimate kinase
MDADIRPTVVELVGLAGSGKSTLARELASGETDVRLGLPLSRAGSAVAQAAAAAPFVLPYLRETRGTAWFSRHEIRDLGYLRAWRGSLPPLTLNTSCIVLDHGPLFRLARLDAFGPPVTSTTAFRRWWDAALDDWAALIDVVVWLDAPDEELIRRIRTRDQQHGLREVDDVAASRFLGTYRASYELVLQQVRRRSPRAMLSLRTDLEPPAVLARKVRQQLSGKAELDV